MNIFKKNHGLISKRYPLFLIFPAFALFFVFYFIPLIQGVWYSFFDWNGFSAEWVGLDNFKNIFVMPRLNTAFINTFIFTLVTTPLKIFLGFLFALAVNRPLKTGNYLRAIIFSPVLLGGIVVGTLFTSIMHPTNGILNQFLRFINLDFMAINWLTDTRFAIFSICLIEIWKFTGFSMTIQLAGLQNIPKDYYECAEIDGASTLKKHLHITLPLMLPTISGNLLFSITGGLAVFDIVMSTTGGGPGYTTSVINTLVYTSFGSGRLGEASAIQLMLGVITTIVVLISTRSLSRVGKGAD